MAKIPPRDSRGRFSGSGGGGSGGGKPGRDSRGRFIRGSRGFGESRDTVIQELEALAARVVVSLSLAVVANLVSAPSEGGTPVDTGWARANWVPAIGSPFDGVVGSRELVSSSAQSAGQASLLSYRLPLGPVFITNNVPYILALNDGHSKQAQRGFIERAIEKAVFVDLQRIFAA